MGQIKNINAFQRYVKKQEWANLLTLVFLAAFLLIGTGVTTYVHYETKRSKTMSQGDSEQYGIIIDSLRNEISEIGDSQSNEIERFRREVGSLRENLDKEQKEKADYVSLIDSLNRKINSLQRQPKSLTIMQSGVSPGGFRINPSELNNKYKIKQLIFIDEDTKVDATTLEYNGNIREARNLAKLLSGNRTNFKISNIERNTDLQLNNYIVKYPTITIF